MNKNRERFVPNYIHSVLSGASVLSGGGIYITRRGDRLTQPAFSVLKVPTSSLVAKATRPRQSANSNLSVYLSRADANASGVEHGVASPGDHDAAFFGDLKRAQETYNKGETRGYMQVVWSSVAASLRLCFARAVGNASQP